jgi:putative restriction endonuclease
MRTSAHLQIGTHYTREELARKFNIKDATLFTGIFKPKNHESIWLFVTENKTPDRIPYKDELAGNDLYIEGQRSGRKDKLLAEHFENDLEVLLFYRKSKYEFNGAAFKYEGLFLYVEQSGKSPTRFHFRRTV